MSSIVFPSLPGLDGAWSRTPEWKTQIKESVSGREFRVAQRSFPRWRYSLKYEVLRSGGLAELQELMAVCNLLAGQFDTCLFTDPEMNSVSGQVIGTGDGSTKTFQLLRSIAGFGHTFVEPVWAVNGTPSVFVGGILQSGVTVSASGAVSLASAPVAGAVVSWSGNYYMRVRLTSDAPQFERVMSGFWANKKIELLSIIP